MRCQKWCFSSALLGNVFAQSTIMIDLQHNRVEQADCPRKLHFCSKTAWSECAAPIISSDRCVAADRLNDVASIAIDLGLCCQFFSDDQCNTVYKDGGEEGQWYPGLKEVSSTFKEQVGSYMCRNGTTSSICPGAGAGNLVASNNAATPTAN
ncbi:hypothetical protein COCCADRAFT_110967 [Bipolaris zeicola 26-R-13]|uniref:Extracellular membrane protein CFEM domain-containing protein n=1 Tax=Cochliobolus carbonum (strain 26-R-13) TaxID=930089 RepID=W6XKI0_COCC2|nr:uncharacterized protein COCCADRAFT_110967 [Bipolaris zeicola 26-R-13]EUC27707.1 hypothetical protein COCCADRAFT_110967 [Bipolaris zeicola 26-R-13]